MAAKKLSHSGQFGKPGGADPSAAGSKGMAARWGKERASIVDAARKLTPAALETLEQVLLNPTAKDADRIRVAELIMSYGFGRPTTMVDLKAQVEAEQPQAIKMDQAAIAASLSAWMEEHGHG